MLVPNSVTRQGIGIGFKLLDSNKEIQRQILEALRKEMVSLMDKAIPKLKLRLSNTIREAIVSQPEYQSLLSGQLKYEFGIPNSSSKLAKLIDVWSTNIKTDYQKPRIVGSKIIGSFSANMIRVDFSDVRYTDYAVVVDRYRGYTLPWLEWLLLEGNKIIVPKHEVVFGRNRASRTGWALMKESRTSWKVPSEFAGTITNNWITRAIDSAEEALKIIIYGAFYGM